MRRNVCGFVDLFNAPELDILTEKRNFGAVTFLGRYGLVDFALSNFTNSGIDTISIITDRYPSSMRSHIGNGSPFIVNTRTGSINVLYNDFGILSKSTNTDILTVIESKNYYEHLKDYVIIAPAQFLMTIDFNPYIDEHIRSGRDVSVLYQHREDLDVVMRGVDKLSIKDGVVKTMSRNDNKKKDGDISIEVFILNKEYFNHILVSQKDISMKYGFREMIKYEVKNLKKEIGAMEYQGFVLPILSLQDYVDASLFLLPYLNRVKLFKEDWPIYTATHNTPPARYGPKANVRNSFVANGSIINGTVENSIISRNVVIEAGASVKNSIILTDSEVGKGVSLNYVVTDKNAKIFEKKAISGTRKEMAVIRRGEKL